MSKPTAQERIDLIDRVCTWCFDNTESWGIDEIGTGLAYLAWAIAADDGEPFDFMAKELPGYYAKFKQLLQSNPTGLFRELVEKGFVIE